MRSSNPVFKTARQNSFVSDNAVTYTNVAVKTIFLIMVAGFVGYYTYINAASLVNYGYLIVAMIVGFISVWVGSVNVKLSPYFSTLYAVVEGYVLGSVSALFATLADGIIPTAIMTTFVVVLISMVFYSTGVIRVTKKFASMLVVGLLSVIVMSLIAMFIPALASSGFYYLIVFVSAILSVLFLFLDFENIKTMVESGTDASYGWILSLGLLVTIVWIYMEVLRILLIIARRR